MNIPKIVQNLVVAAAGTYVVCNAPAELNKRLIEQDAIKLNQNTAIIDVWKGEESQNVINSGKSDPASMENALNKFYPVATPAPTSIDFFQPDIEINQPADEFKSILGQEEVQNQLNKGISDPTAIDQALNELHQ